MTCQNGSDRLRFDGRVAIVTGAGGQPPNLGRAYSFLLASRGAKVVVNDLGVGPDGRGGLPADAEVFAQEIRDAGGDAVADTHSVAGSESAKSVVRTALEAYGRVDILINNAGVVVSSPFDELPDEDVERIVDTHVYGHIWMSRAAWPHMKDAGYGRIVNISSRSILGNPGLAVYGAAKAAVVGLARALAREGEQHGINVNVLAPDAATRKHQYMFDISDEAQAARIAVSNVDHVAPVVVYLCHQCCELSGRFVWAGGGGVSELLVTETRGYRNPRITIEDVHANVDRIADPAGAGLVHMTAPRPLANASQENA